MAEFHIGDRPVGPEEPTFIIAEAGSNHNGEIEIAKELIDIAADAGADAVKFQTFRAEDLYVDDRDFVDDTDESTYALLESLEQPYEWIPELYEYCQSQDVLFMSTPFDERSARKLSEYVPAFKVASFTLSHHPFLENLAEYEKPIIMSTGSHEQEEIEEAVSVLRDHGIEDIALLHCVSSYPTPLEEINVRAVETLDREFETAVGFSDHTMEPAIAPAAAVALGASVVEKHFTLDKEMDGPDHSFALEPDELTEMIETIRKTERTLGDGEITITEVESGSEKRARRALFVTEELPSGTVLTENDLNVLRPGREIKERIPPKYIDELVGRELTQAVGPDEPLRWNMLTDFNQY